MPSHSNFTHSSASDPLIGLEVAHVFKIREQIGAGACSRVFRAEHLGLHQTVAIKVLNHEYIETEDIRIRFHREARIATRIAHPAVVSVLMTGELPNSGITRGEAFIVYEFVDGMTLRQLLDARARLSVETTVGIVIAMGEAVGVAHHLGIVHRDLKPENLMIVESDRGKRSLRVLDFGIAKLYESSELPLTHTGAILGTPSYLAPEAARGCPATPRSDVYSMATIAYECLAGRPPFRDASAIKVLMQQVESEPEPLAHADGAVQVPEAITAVIQENLSKLPEARAEDAHALARTLRRAAATAGVEFEDLGLDSTLWQDCSLDDEIGDTSHQPGTPNKTGHV